MKKQHMNRNVIVRTCRLCLPAACLSLLAACAAKPIEQDLAAGEATVEIKYLDGVTMDIVDETRTMRRTFYDDALKNRKKEYSQGIQGAVDRVSTIAAAVNANAQRDKSVLDRYYADGDRQLSALENSEELGDELLEHNKKLIQQTNELNEAKVSAAESQAETLAELNKAKVEIAKTAIESYNENIETINNKIDELQSEKKDQNERAKKLQDDIDKLSKKINNLSAAELESNPNVLGWKAELKKAEDEFEKLKGNKSGQTGSIKEIDNSIDELTDKKENLYNALVKLIGGGSNGSIPTETGLLTSTTESGGKITGLSVSKGDVTDSLSGVGFNEVEYREDNTGKIVDIDKKDAKKITTKEVIISQHPQAQSPQGVNYLETALRNISMVDKLDKSNTDEAVRRTREMVSPPIERIRNDEAVFDYLIDGYRNTQVSSGAEYGGMVRRVLPFSFTFTPGKSTQSGFAARVLLKADQQQIDEAAAMIAPHLNAVMQDSVIGYMQDYESAEHAMAERIGIDNGKFNLTHALLLESYDSESCLPGYTDETEKKYSWEELENSLSESRYLKDTNEKNAFWRAYGASIDIIRKIIANGKALDDSDYPESVAYRYDLTAEDVKNLLSAAQGIQNAGREESGEESILKLSSPDFSDSQRTALKNICYLNKKLEGELNKIGEEEKGTVARQLREINRLAMAMTSAALTDELRLRANPVYGKEHTVITIKSEKRSDEIHYNASVMPVNLQEPKETEKIKTFVNNAAGLRIVQNTSREHVVEIPDTAKMNTFLSAALTGNDVSQQLGLAAGGQLAAAISSSSAFMKRLPYAVPFTGQTLSLSGGRKNTEQNQAFGWRFYKTPSGVQQMGGISQSFKTTPVNSAVVVSMPEWISKLEATYELSEDGGTTWRTVGSEKITLAGASLRGALSSGPSSFDTWAKYHLYREVDGKAGMPKLKSCYGDGGKFIYGNSNGYTALCGENLYGVKAVLIGGQPIENIKKVSSHLIMAQVPDLEKQDCIATESVCKKNGECSDKCKIVLLSDFGAHPASDKKDDVYLDFTFAPKRNDQEENLESYLGKVTVTDNGNDTEKIKIVFENRVLDSFALPGAIKKKPEDNLDILFNKKDLVEFCKRTYPCEIPITGDIVIGSQKRTGLLYTIHIDRLVEPYVNETPVKDGSNYIVYIEDYRKHPFFSLKGIEFEGKNGRLSLTKTQQPTRIEENNDSILVTLIGDEIEKTCGKEEKCRVHIVYAGGERKYIGEISLPPPSDTAISGN